MWLELESKNKNAGAAAGTRKNKKQKKTHPTSLSTEPSPQPTSSADESTTATPTTTTTTAIPPTPTSSLPPTPTTTTTTTIPPTTSIPSVITTEDHVGTGPAPKKTTTQAAGKQPKSATRRGSGPATTTTATTTTMTMTPSLPPSSVPTKTSSRAYLNEDDEEVGLAPGDKVAARISGEASDIYESLVILASVVRPLDRNRYEIEDEDPGDESEPNPIRKHYKLHRTKITPLPKDFQAHKIMSKGSIVLAMFPDTTTFYPATVEKVPTSANQPYYSLKFENDEEDGKTPLRKVKFNFVIALPTTTSHK